MSDHQPSNEKHPEKFADEKNYFSSSENLLSALNLNEGDIIEVEHGENRGFMIYAGFVGSKPYAFFCTKGSAIPSQTVSPSFMQKWVTGYKKTDDFASQNEIQCVKINQGPVDHVIQNATIKKNNFDHVNLAPNAPEIIVDRAMFKVLDDKSNPHFQNCNDWVIWCRYGKDIIKRDTNVPSQIQLVSASGRF